MAPPPPPAGDPAYALGHGAAEQQRLIAQEAVYGPLTERLLRAAGIRAGMRVLDVGCGVGDVSLRLARLVGERGAVVGIDRAPAALAAAAERARAAGLANARFVEADLAAPPAGDPFDAAVGRFVLMHLADPAAGLRGVAGRVRAGGVVAFVESDFSIPPLAYPPLALYARATRLWGPPKGAPAERAMGLKLHRAFLDAGLPAPETRLEAPLGGGPDYAGYAYLAATLRAVVPLQQQRGQVAAEDVAALGDLETLAERLRAETVAAGAVISAPAVVGAWSRVPRRP
jgi:SAM-dependent methyltransferase